MTETNNGGITLRKALGDYKTIHLAYRNYATRTREEYLNDLEGLIRFLEKLGINHVKAISLPLIERYVAKLEQEGLTGRTRKRKVVSIRSFLAFLYQEGYIETNIANKVILPFTESRLPNVLTQTECDKLWNACAENPRDGAIIELLLQTGIKLSELIHLTLDDIRFDQKEKAGAHQKGLMRIKRSRAKKDGLIPLNNRACIALKNYLNVRGNAENSALFLNRFDQPLGERGVERMLKKYLKKAKIGRVTTQTLRHTFGAYHMVHGTNLKTLQEVMGYKDMRSMDIYSSLVPVIKGNEMQDHSL